MIDGGHALTVDGGRQEVASTALAFLYRFAALSHEMDPYSETVFGGCIPLDRTLCARLPLTAWEQAIRPPRTF